MEEEPKTDANDITADTFFHASSAKRENSKTMFTTENLDKLDKLVDAVKNLKINDGGYYESLYMSFMLGDSNIRYICDTQHLNIICIILYFDFFYKHYFHYNIYAIILISLHRTAGSSRCLFLVILNKFVVLTNNKPGLFTFVI